MCYLQLHCSVQSYWEQDAAPLDESVIYHSSNSYWMGMWVSHSHISYTIYQYQMFHQLEKNTCQWISTFFSTWQVEPRIVNLYGPSLLSAEVKMNATLPMGCDCCTYWNQYGNCELLIDIVTHGTSIETGLLHGHQCRFSLGSDITEDIIPIVAQLRTGTTQGTFTVSFEPISIVYDVAHVSVWAGYTGPSIQVTSNLTFYVWAHWLP